MPLLAFQERLDIDELINELEEESLPPEIASLPIFQDNNRRFVYFEYGRCKLKTLDELEDLKIQLQKIYFNPSATAKGKRVIFHHLRKLSSRIARIRFDGRRIC